MNQIYIILYKGVLLVSVGTFGILGNVLSILILSRSRFILIMITMMMINVMMMMMKKGVSTSAGGAGYSTDMLRCLAVDPTKSKYKQVKYK